MNLPENTPAFQRQQALWLAERAISVIAWERIQEAKQTLAPAFEGQPAGRLDAAIDALLGLLAAPRLTEQQRAALIDSHRAELLALTPNVAPAPVRALRAVEAG